MGTIDYVEDWKARLRSRLYTQFRDKESWILWCDEVLGPQFQDLEDSAQSMLTLLDIDASIGVQLDVIGRLIGQARLGVADAIYRLYLRARILANKSTGTPENIYSVMRALFGTDAAPRYMGGWVKQFAIRLAGVELTREEALVGASFLRDSKEAGARGILEWRESPEDETFTMWDAAVLTVPIVAGVLISSVSVTSTEGYPASGYLKFGDDYSGFFMNSKTATTFNTTLPITPTVSYGVGTPIGMFISEVGATDAGFDEGDFAGAIQS